MLHRAMTGLFLAGACVLPLAAAAVAPAQSTVSAAPAVARRATLEDLATKLTDRFFDPEVGQRYAAMLRSAATSGKYASITDDAEFAKQLTADLQAVAFDGHLRVFKLAPGQALGPQARIGKALPKTVEASARLTKDIAYIRFGSFLREPGGIEAIKKFLDDNKDAKTLILDVRTHIGGGLDEMDAMFPYLFDKPTTLVDMDTRASVSSGGNVGSRLRRIPAPATIVRREHFVVPATGPSPLAKAEIFVLASGRTGSAGEHFVLAMRRTHRATVIGETTYGAGNYGGEVELAGGYSAFIPVGRTFDPDTGKGWDYVGIAPNVAVPAASALVEALVRSGIPKAESEKLSAANGPPAEAMTSKRKAPDTVPGI